MIHFAWVLVPGILAGIIGVIAACNTYGAGRFFSVLAATIGVGAIIYVIIAWNMSSGYTVICTETYELQEVKVSNGGTIQVVVFDSGRIFNITAAANKHFPAGRITRRWLWREPKGHLYWDTESEQIVEWVSAEVKERE